MSLVNGRLQARNEVHALARSRTTSQREKAGCKKLPNQTRTRSQSRRQSPSAGARIISRRLHPTRLLYRYRYRYRCCCRIHHHPCCCFPKSRQPPAHRNTYIHISFALAPPFTISASFFRAGSPVCRNFRPLRESCCLLWLNT